MLIICNSMKYINFNLIRKPESDFMCGLSHSRKGIMGGMSHIVIDRDVKRVFMTSRVIIVYMDLIKTRKK
jgi:hypothetical protein